MDHIWVTPLPQLGLWTFEPTLLFFHTRQRFPISNHVTSGWMSPRSSLDHWSAVSHTGNDMTSSSGHVIALDQSGASLSDIRASFTTSGVTLKHCRSNLVWFKFHLPLSCLSYTYHDHYHHDLEQKKDNG